MILKNTRISSLRDFAKQNRGIVAKHAFIRHCEKIRKDFRGNPRVYCRKANLPFRHCETCLWQVVAIHKIIKGT